MPYEFHQTRHVEFAETDLAGIVHFANFFRYMEEAEHAFFRSLGLSVHGEIGGRLIGWPRIHARCSYIAPLRFEEQFEVHLVVCGKRRKSIAYEFLFRRQGGELVARGKLAVVCASPDPATGRLRAVDIPRQIDEKIEVAPAELLRTLRAERCAASPRSSNNAPPASPPPLSEGEQ